MASSPNWRRPHRIEPTPTPKPLFGRFIQTAIFIIVILGITYIMLMT